MLVNDSGALARLNSKNNLINRLGSLNKRSSAMGLFGIGRTNKEDEKVPQSESLPEKITASFNPFEKKAILQEVKTSQMIPIEEPSQEKEEPSLNNLIENSDTQIKLAAAHDNALSVLTSAIETMRMKLDDVKAEKLPAVIAATSKVVESIRKERNEAARSGKDRVVHYHLYTPTQKKIEAYEVIEVS